LGSISKDPIGFAAGDANLERYVGNQTSVACDADGLQKKHPLLPDIYKDGPYIGTPKVPKKLGENIAIYGEQDNPAFEDYATEKKYEIGTDKIKRPLTDRIPNDSVAHISIRNAMVSPTTWKEIIRIGRPGTTVTITQPRMMGFKMYKDVLNLKIVGDYQVISRPMVLARNIRHPDTRQIIKDLDFVAFSVVLSNKSTYIEPENPVER
jgi:hypothetical protein